MKRFTTAVLVTAAAALLASGCNNTTGPEQADPGTATPAEGASADPGMLMDEPVFLGKTMEFGKDAPRSSNMRWDMIPMNTASVANKSLPDQQCPFVEVAYDKNKGPDTPISEYVTEILEQPSIRHEPFGVLYSFKQLDYWKNRLAVHAEFEKQVAAEEGDRFKELSENYMYVLMYMGEFDKIIEWVPAHMKGWEEDRFLGAANFVLAQAYFRKGDHDRSWPHAKIAQDLLVDSPNDTRWQLMLTEMGLYKGEFYQKYSRDRMSLEHLPTWFPEAEWKLPFKDVTDQKMPKDFERWGGYGYTWMVDMDKDGWDDIFYQRKWYGATFYKNLKGAGFERIDETDTDLGLGMPHGAQPADYDNDGHLDWYETCCNYDGTAPLHLLKGKGDYKFEDVAAKAGVQDAKVCGMAMLWIDYDLDSWLDIFMTNWCGKTRVYHNNGDGTFTEVHDQAGFKTPGSYWGATDEDWFGSHGVNAGHFFNDDPFPDIYLQGWGWRQIYQNNGDGTFTLKGGHGAPEGAATGVEGGRHAKNYWSFTFDFNNDGMDDILSGSYVVGAEERFGISPRCTCSNLLTPNGFSGSETDAAPTVFMQTAPGKFKDIRDKTRIVPLGAMGYTMGDWNNDGFEDMVFGLGGPYFQQAEPYLFYENNGGDGTFTNKTPFTMFSLWGKGHGLSFGDYNHDGHVDMMINNGGAMPGDNWPGLLLENTGESANHFIEVNLKAGKGSNRSAIGALVTLKAGDMNRRKWLWSGSTFGQNSFTLHFGLGKNTKIDELVVHWPNNPQTVTTLNDLAVDQAIEVDQDSGKHTQVWSAPVQ